MKPIRLFAGVVFALMIVISVAVFADDKPVSGSDSAVVNIELKGVPVKDAINTLFEGRGLKYYIQPGVAGKVVELRMRGITFDQALKALADASGFSYTIQDGAYIISPAKTAVATTTQPQQIQQPVMQMEPLVSDVGLGQNQPNNQAPPPSQVVVNQNVPSPTYYGHPAPEPDYGPYAGGYGYPPPIYQFGNLGIVGTPWGAPVVIAGGTSSIRVRGPYPPPPPGWVSPDVLRFLRGIYSVRIRPYFINQY